MKTLGVAVLALTSSLVACSTQGGSTPSSRTPSASYPSGNNALNEPPPAPKKPEDDVVQVAPSPVMPTDPDHSFGPKMQSDFGMPRAGDPAPGVVAREPEASGSRQAVAPPTGAEPSPTPPSSRSTRPEDDRLTTRQIRQALLSDNTISTPAKYVSIVTNGGKVTLRGEVPTERDREVVQAAATTIVGEDHVENQVTVKAKK